MKDLFEIPVSKSPRLLWLEKNDIKTFRSPGPAEAFDGEPWNCWQGDFEEAVMKNDTAATGATEDEAIVNWAKMHGYKLWNEEAICLKN